MVGKVTMIASLLLSSFPLLNLAGINLANVLANLAPDYLIVVPASFIALAASNPTVDSITPSGGTAPVGEWINFATQFSDADGVDGSNIRGIYFLINAPLTTANQSNSLFPNSVEFLYRNDLNRLYLLNDTGTTWLGNAVPEAPNVFIENSQVKIDISKTKVSKTTNIITIN